MKTRYLKLEALAALAAAGVGIATGHAGIAIVGLSAYGATLPMRIHGPSLCATLSQIQRQTVDAQKSVIAALPAAGASSVIAIIDLGTVTPGRIVDDFDVEIVVPATPALADTKNLTLTIQDSADGVTFANIAGGPAAVVYTGAGGVGAAGGSTVVKVPNSVRRYIGLLAAVDAAGGDNTGVSATFQLRF